MSNPFELSSAEHDRIYAAIASRYLNRCEPQSEPRAVIIGGQPGSGKGQLTQQAGRELFKDGSFVLVDVDTLRSRHPFNNQLMRENDREAANLTHNDASKWAKRLTTDAIEARRNIIIDQTSKSPNSLIARTKQLREAGYKVELRVMAVNAETSQERIHTRYENQKAADGAGRFVPKEVHDAAYIGLPESVAAVEREKTVDALSIHDKRQRKIYENALHNGEWVQRPPGGKDALEAERNREPTLEERRDHAVAYTKLADMLDKRGAEPSEREYIEALRLKAVRKFAAETFRQLPREEALKTHPELAGAYASLAAIAAKAKADGLSAEQRQIVAERAKYHAASAIEQGRTPNTPLREVAQDKQVEASRGSNLER